jgi:hypothetical protein
MSLDNPTSAGAQSLKTLLAENAERLTRPPQPATWRTAEATAQT